MKAQAASLTLYHFEPGHHREVCLWHDQDHKPEVLASVPGIFVSQRWVAPSDLKSTWPASSLEHGGGEYVNLYWTTSTPSELEQDFHVLGRRLEAVGRMEPMRYIHRTWGRRLRPVSFRARSGLALSAEAVTCAPQTTGLMLVIGEMADGAQRDAFARWHETEHIPMILECGLFTGAVKLMSDAEEDRNLFVTFYYTDQADPCAAYLEYQPLSTSWPRFENVDEARRIIHRGMYVPSIGHYEYYA